MNDFTTQDWTDIAPRCERHDAPRDDPVCRRCLAESGGAPVICAAANHRDVISDLLRSIRVRDVFFGRMHGFEPWDLSCPSAAEVAASAMPGAQHVVAFHMVTRGTCWAHLAGSEPLRLRAGDIVMYAHGDGHRLTSAREPGPHAGPGLGGFRPAPSSHFAVVVNGQTLRPASDLDLGAAGPAASIVCGFLSCDPAQVNTVLSALPAQFRIRTSGTALADMIEPFAALFTIAGRSLEPGYRAVAERFGEAILIESLRVHLNVQDDEPQSWVSATADRFVGPALALLHGDPARHWTTRDIAAAVGLSRSALHDRFSRCTGLTPMRYVTRLRMQSAVDRLSRRGESCLTAIALEVGYESASAFSRAFKRETGVPPEQWRLRSSVEAS